MFRPDVYYEATADFGTGFHCGPFDGNDFTLCGFSLDGDQAPIEQVKNKPPRIDCPKCLAIIHFCRKLSARTFEPENASAVSRPNHQTPTDGADDLEHLDCMLDDRERG